MKCHSALEVFAPKLIGLIRLRLRQSTLEDVENDCVTTGLLLSADSRDAAIHTVHFRVSIIYSRAKTVGVRVLCSSFHLLLPEVSGTSKADVKSKDASLPHCDHPFPGYHFR